MSRKYTKINGYHFFAKDWKLQEEKHGATFPNGIKDVKKHPKCREAWEKLSKQDKFYYESFKKMDKITIKSDKKTTTGESIKEIERKKKEEEMFIMNMKKYIKTIVTKANEENRLEKFKFYVIHANYSYSRLVNNELEYYPIEISIAEFSLEEGVTRTYHKIIYSKVHVGYCSAVLEHSTATHQIPKDEGEKDHALIYGEIRNFLEPGKREGKYPVLYTRYEAYDVKFPIISILNSLRNAYTLENPNTDLNSAFTVYSFEELFCNIYTISSPEFNNGLRFDSILMHIWLNTTAFDFQRSLYCEFHKKYDAGGNYCSQNHVQKWIFVLFDRCSKLIKNSIEGRHRPKIESPLIESFEFNDNEGWITKSRKKLYSAAKNTIIKHRSERTVEDERNRRQITKPIEIVHHIPKID